MEKAPEGGFVRLYLPGVTSTQTPGDDLASLTADAYYVVRRPDDDGLFVDFLALSAFEYRVTELTEAGQLAIDFRRAPGGLTCPAVQSEDIVVVQPCEAEEAVAGEPLAVEGYSRNPGGSLSVVLLSEEGADNVFPRPSSGAAPARTLHRSAPAKYQSRWASGHRRSFSRVL